MIQIIEARYGYERDEGKVFKAPSKGVDKRLLNLLRKNGKIGCQKKDFENCDHCNGDDEHNCNLFFKNYIGLFSYYEDQDNKKEVLIIHKKICELIKGCSDSSQCRNCDINSINEDEQKLKTILQNYNNFFASFSTLIINSLCEHLTFELISPVSAYVSEDRYSENLSLKLLLLLKKKEEIKSSIHHIFANPHRTVVGIEELMRYDEVTYIDSDVIVDMIQNPQRWVSHTNGCIMNEYSPYEVLQYKIEESFDTLENRYIKELLIKIDEIIHECIEYIQNKKYTLSTDKFKDFKEELSELKDEIEQALRYGLFNNVGELTQLPTNSQVLIKQAGYRELFVIDRLLRVTLVPSFIANTDDAFELKSMDTLWELYLMVKIIEAIKELGFIIKEQKWDERYGREDEYNYASFIFNRQNKEVIVSYQDSVKVGKTGKSVLRPDFLLQCENKRIVIDAKYMFKENIPTSDIIKYLTSQVYTNESDKMEKLSHAVFAGCLADSINMKGYVCSFTHLFNDFLKNDQLEKLKIIIDSYLIQKCEEKEDTEQYIGFIPIELPKLTER